MLVSSRLFLVALLGLALSVPAALTAQSRSASPESTEEPRDDSEGGECGLTVGQVLGGAQVPTAPPNWIDERPAATPDWDGPYVMFYVAGVGPGAPAATENGFELYQSVGRFEFKRRLEWQLQWALDSLSLSGSQQRDWERVAEVWYAFFPELFMPWPRALGQHIESRNVVAEVHPDYCTPLRAMQQIHVLQALAMELDLFVELRSRWFDAFETDVIHLFDEDETALWGRLRNIVENDADEPMLSHDFENEPWLTAQAGFQWQAVFDGSRPVWEVYLEEAEKIRKQKEAAAVLAEAREKADAADVLLSDPEVTVYELEPLADDLEATQIRVEETSDQALNPTEHVRMAERLAASVNAARAMHAEMMGGYAAQALEGATAWRQSLEDPATTGTRSATQRADRLGMAWLNDVLYFRDVAEVPDEHDQMIELMEADLIALRSTYQEFDRQDAMAQIGDARSLLAAISADFAANALTPDIIQQRLNDVDQMIDRLSDMGVSRWDETMVAERDAVLSQLEVASDDLLRAMSPEVEAEAALDMPTTP